MAAFNESDYVKLELELAELLGWSNFHVAENSIFGVKTFGTPPYEDFDFDTSGTRCTMPQWCRDWQSCGQLILKHGISVMSHQEGAAEVRYWTSTAGYETIRVDFDGHLSPEHSLRAAIVEATIEKLTIQSMKEKTNETAA